VQVHILAVNRHRKYFNCWSKKKHVTHYLIYLLFCFQEYKWTIIKTIGSTHKKMTRHSKHVDQLTRKWQGIKNTWIVCDFFRSVVDFSFEKDTIRHIFTGQYYGLQEQFQNPIEKSKKKQANSIRQKHTRTWPLIFLSWYNHVNKQ
jgi:hypothetical protein